MNSLRKAGYTVWDTHTVGGGFPDIIACNGSHNVLMEIKMPNKKLNEKEKQFFEIWNGPIAIVNSPENAIWVMQQFK